ncbi:MAG: TIGR03790 family protein [Armatimonadetes bacterium]|nr:TIGR03790 family protein [Armatimonadota bacterium]
MVAVVAFFRGVAFRGVAFRGVAFVAVVAWLPLVALGQTDPEEAKRVLVVINQPSHDSLLVGTYYRAKRNIPRENVVFIDVSRTEEISNSEYRSAIERPVRAAIAKLKHRIDFIVLTKGVPIRVRQGKYSVDALLAAMNLTFKPIEKLEEEAIRRAISPYFQKDEPFSSEKFGFYLVTRLDGYTVEDAKALVDNSLAAKPDKGPFFFDEAANRNSKGYIDMQSTLGKAHATLQKKGFDSTLDTTENFLAPEEPLMGYASWGSNDGKFDLATYRKIKFKPGAICETFVSTNGRTFKRIPDDGQSLITDLIANGVTGIKGYVSEPFTFALAKPDILFDRYTSGRNLAESFYAASMVLKWKGIVIGDPLCSPYAKR